ncbi:hypothetical protein NQ315_005079 [Exocentrus adspersus]|uniref:Uncharacterized protein n=1 Tax=Exocentrus adspersus TaxID=1586481 RepID=A0AAV8VPM1_9CUCU|nr:hypothetical protein NQ315_005079 [Exocentrus adspersus]
MTVASEEVSFAQRWLWIFNTIFHQAVAVVTIFLLWLFFENYDSDNVFLWHLVLSTAAVR